MALTSARAAALRVRRRIHHFQASKALFLSQSEQSSTQNASWGKVREPSFESKIGGVGPVVAGALDRSRRLISTAAAASDGAVQICKENPYNCTEYPYTCV